MPAQVGSYQVLFELARGGMGTVFLARALGAGGFERLVAIKRAHEQGSSDEFVQRFLAEARIAACVHHANVVSTHLAASDESGHYLVCDYVEGASLGELIERADQGGIRIPASVVLRIAVDALAGLHAVHEARDASETPLGILHRDVSVQNLLVGRDGVTRLTDFGIAKSTLNNFVTDQGYVVGKLVYAAPEYLRGTAIDRRVDVYGLGISLWTALAGKIPWRPPAHDNDFIEQIIFRGAPPLASSGVAVDASIAAIVDRACHRDARERYATAGEMLDALEHAARAADCLAGHSEVAACVEALVGTELAVRREAIRAHCAALSDPPAAGEQTPPAVTRPAASPGEQHAFREITAVTASRWMRRWPRRAAIAGVVALVLAAAYLLSLHVAARRAAAPTARAPLPAATSSPVTNAPVVAREPAREAVDVAPAPPVAPLPPGIDPPTPAVRASRRAPRKAPPPAASAEPADLGLDHISKTNPYR